SVCQLRHLGQDTVLASVAACISDAWRHRDRSSAERRRGPAVFPADRLEDFDGQQPAMGVDDDRRGLAASGKDAHLRQEALVDALGAEEEVIALPAAVPADADEMLADGLVGKLWLQHRLHALRLERERRPLAA